MWSHRSGTGWVTEVKNNDRSSGGEKGRISHAELFCDKRKGTARPVGDCHKKGEWIM